MKKLILNDRHKQRGKSSRETATTKFTGVELIFC